MEQQVSYNTSCEFSCENGYTLQGMSPLSCLASGNFSNEIPTCQIVTCLLPETFSQELSSVDCDAGSSIDFNSLCTFECSEGHDLVGSSTITCQSNGEVSASIPTCSVVSCSIPEFPSRLSSMTSQCNDGQSINYTQTCSFSCDTGYNLVGSSSVTCLDNSSLSDSLPTCEIETCGVPQLLSPLSTSCPMGQHVRYNTSCEFSCENGYTLQGMPSLTCLASGNFSDEVPNCQIETCGVPQILPPLSTTCPMGQQVGYNTSCEFSCENGYTLQGMPSLSCLASGNFSDDFPTCNIVSCSLPEVFSEELSSSVNCDAGSTIVFNTTCSFECSIGYSLIGVENITCQTDGLLSAAVPYCNVVTCSIPMFPANLTTPNTQCGEEMMIDYNTMCMYECQQGYDLIGNASIGCQANGELSTNLPTCQVIDICQRFSPCPTVSTCNGGISTFSCSCDAGYTTDVTITSDTTTYTCVNINECNASPPVCDSNARCNDLSGSYLCTCMEGFSGNGTFCEGTEYHSCSRNVFEIESNK
nr:P-selectin-like [Lytechinus pictus]